MGALDDLADAFGLDSSSKIQKGAVATFFTAPAAFIIKIVLETFVLQPVAITLGTLDRWIGATWASVTGAVRFALREPATAVRQGFLRPCGVEGKPCGLIPLYFESTAGTLTDAGVAAPVATAIANTVAVAVLAGLTYLAVSALSGGTITSTTAAAVASARRLL